LRMLDQYDDQPELYLFGLGVIGDALNGEVVGKASSANPIIVRRAVFRGRSRKNYARLVRGV